MSFPSLRTKEIIAVGFFVLLSVILFFFIFPSSKLVEIKAERCERSHPTVSQKGDCWDGVIAESFDKGGVRAGMDTVAYLYKTYPAFLQSNCHRHAHRVGDLTYYREYRQNPDLDSIDFSDSTTACGFGFYGGFIEHMLQDRPDPNFMIETCDYFRNRLGSRMKEIENMCYHSAAHGLLLAYSEDMLTRITPQQGVETALLQCDAMNIESTPKEFCRRGVYHQLMLWMGEGSFGLSAEKPLSMCDQEPLRWQSACYFSLSQGIEARAAYDPLKLAELLKEVKNPSLHAIAFRVGIGNMVKPLLETDPFLKGLLDRCEFLNDPLFSECVRAAVKGLFVFGSPGIEYEKALLLCNEERIKTLNAVDACYRETITYMNYFYDQEKITGICTSMPEIYRAACVKNVTLPIE